MTAIYYTVFAYDKGLLAAVNSFLFLVNAKYHIKTNQEKPEYKEYVFEIIRQLVDKTSYAYSIAKMDV